MDLSGGRSPVGLTIELDKSSCKVSNFVWDRPDLTRLCRAGDIT